MNLTKEAANSLLPHLSALRRELHHHPELALEEHQTARLIERELDALNIPHQRVGQTGVLGLLRGGRPGAGAVALRADIDALPIQEQNDCPFRSSHDGVMHACGHDAHTAMLLGASKLLAERRDAWSGEVRLMFQPAEETGKGAPDFLAAGCLDGVNRVFGLHVAPDLPIGTVGIKPDLNNAAVDGFRILIRGRSSHVSNPQLGVDALYIGSHIVTALQAQVTRRTSPVEPVILGIGSFHSGTTYNALAETAVLEGTTRTISPASRQRAREQVESTASGIAAMYGGTAQVTWDDIASALVNDPPASREAAELIAALRPDLTVTTSRPLSMGGDNVSEFLLKVPGVYAYLGVSNPQKPETLAPLHSGRFQLDEDVLPTGAWLYAACAAHWLKQERETGESL